MLKKGIVCIGCSHTWGGGLEWYSNHTDVLERESDGTFDSNNISYATYKFISANRWSRLLSNQLGTWEVNRYTNSGSEDGSIEWLKYIFSLEHHYGGNTKLKKCYLNGDLNLKFDFNEIDYVIVQLTDPFRNNVIYLNDKPVELNIAKVRRRDNPNLNKIDNFKGNITEELYNEFYNFYFENFKSYKDMEDYFCKQNLTLLEKLFRTLEDNGVKCRVWSWQKEYVPFLKDNNFLNKRYIKFQYDNKEFDSLSHLFDYNPKFVISKSDYRINGKRVNDDHQTIECHKITADSIASFIKKENNV